ncbi:MAG: glycoside hydrolase family 127 protein, partial [Alistipes sp.]|nr:glycoside hydrolase family 127 protein [Alistipes sp.]
MKRFILLLAFVAMTFVSCHNKGITPVSFTNVHVEDTFWRQRLDTLRNKTIRYAFERSDRAGYVRNFAIAAGLMEGRFQSGQPFDDADLFKVIEGAAYLLKVEPDPELEQYVDSIIDIVVAAQEPDGYLFTNRTINNPLHPWCGKERWETDWNLSHETFNAGELYEAAVAYYDATGKRKMLDAAIKNADLVCKDFNWDGIVMAPGHAVIEMALVRLYEATGDKKYLDEARFFLDCRGHREFDPTSDDLRVNGKYWQDHLPATEQREAVGHAVRALYFYSGMADIALHQGDKEYLATADSIWENIVSKKFYITGGLGARAHNEAFGENYELPNGSAYCETCASIANAMFNLRMFRLHGDSKYIDVLERSLYNTVLCGISITGDSYFYPNPLETGQGGQLRSAWFGCSCCPTNVCRIIPSVPGYVYATEGNRIYANLYMSSRSEIELGGKQVVLRQRTE